MSFVFVRTLKCEKWQKHLATLLYSKRTFKDLVDFVGKHFIYFAMDRTIIAPYKAEEKELSEKLYRKLSGLMLIYPPTDEFRRCFTTDMFLKPNQTAFLQVMHFLFRLHDPNEFKKRFYWPISDKRSESNFRSATVEYLKFLSDKHHLNWNIKSYLVVMPHGMKFIVFLLDLVGFVIQEQIRLREKQLGTNLPKDELHCELMCKRMQKQNEFFKEYASHYITEVDAQISSLRSKTQEIKTILFKFESLISRKINKEFLNDFEVENKKLFEEKFVKHAESIESLEKPLNELKESIEKFQIKATEHRKDKGSLQKTLKNIASNVSSELEDTICAQVDSSDGPTLNSMIAAFIVIAPKIENWMKYVIESNKMINGNGTFELNDLKTRYQEIQMQLTDFQRKYNPAKIERKDALCKDIVCSLVSNSPLLLKYIHTPPIKFNIAENITARLPLQDETNLMENCGNYLTLMPTYNVQQKRKKENFQDQSFEFNSSLNQSKITDPAQLLRTIYRGSVEKSNRTIKLPTQQQKNLSLLGLKWKERQQMMFGAEKGSGTTISINPPKQLNENISSPHEKQTNRIIIQSPNTAFNKSTGEITRIALSISYEKSPSNILIKKPLVVQKVQDATLNIQNLSTSPSGRLESLTPQEDVINDPNLLKTPLNYHSFDFNTPNDDEIFNTSDTILNDII